MALDKLSGNSFATGAIANSLGYTPIANTSAAITTVLGYTPANNTSAGITTALGYTPVNKAGDTMTSQLRISTDDSMVSFYRGGYYEKTVGQRANGNFVINGGGNFAGVDLLTITPGGAVGINNTAPVSTLTVSGNTTLVGANGSSTLVTKTFNTYGNTTPAISLFTYNNALGFSSFIGFGADPGADWRIGKSIWGANSAHFQIGRNDNTDIYYQIAAGGYHYASVAGGTTVYPAYFCRAWGIWTCSNGSIIGSGGITSVTRNYSGSYTVSFSTAFPDANYVCTTGLQRAATRDMVNEGFARGTTSTTIETFSEGSMTDLNKLQVAFFR